MHFLLLKTSMSVCFFVQPCKVFLDRKDVKFMFNEMIQRSEQVFFRYRNSVLET